MLDQDQVGESSMDPADHSLMEITNMVSAASRDVSGLPNPTSGNNILLTDPHGNLHPLILKGHLQLVAWTVSGIPYKVEAFWTKLSLSCVQQYSDFLF